MPPILVATDFSKSADKALARALELARALGAPLELLHVHEMSSMPVPPTLDVATSGPSAESVTRTEQALVEAAQRMKAAGVACETYATFGRPADEIIKRAQQIGAAYIVVGTRGHSALEHLFVGSTAERVVKQAVCPVVVVP